MSLEESRCTSRRVVAGPPTFVLRGVRVHLPAFGRAWLPFIGASTLPVGGDGRVGWTRGPGPGRLALDALIGLACAVMDPKLVYLDEDALSEVAPKPPGG